MDEIFSRQARSFPPRSCRIAKARGMAGPSGRRAARLQNEEGPAAPPVWGGAAGFGSVLPEAGQDIFSTSRFTILGFRPSSVTTLARWPTRA